MSSSLRALRACLLAGVIGCAAAMAVPDASAQRRRAAPVPPAPPPIPAACVDFYTDTNHGWLAAHPPVRGMQTVSALGELPQRAAAQQMELLDALVNAPTDEDSRAQRLLAYLWASGLDEAAIEADAAAPLAPYLARINAITRARDLPGVLAALHRVGIAAGFSFSIEADESGPPHYRATFSESGAGLPDPAYYLRDDEDTRALRARYLAYIQRILILTGSSEDTAEAQAQQILALETRLAGVSRPLPALHASDRAVTVPTRDLNRRWRNLNLRDFVKAQGVNPASVTIANPDALAELDRLAASLPPDEWKLWLRFQLAHALAPYLSAAFREAGFAFYGRILRGQSAPPPHRRQVLDAINRVAGPLLAREYSARHLTAETRFSATLIAFAVRDALRRAVQRSTWLTDDGKQAALATLDALRIEIAPVDDADPADISAADSTLPVLDRDHFAANLLAVSAWRTRARLRLLDAARADPDAELLAQQPVLAYDRAHNRLRVSAAALQEPVWQADDTLAAHYGSFGALVAHQLSRAVVHPGQETAAKAHAGAGSDEAEHAAWDALLARLAAQYGGYPVPGVRGVYLNGERTAEENAADLAAVELAFAALTNVQPDPDPSAKETFFRRWAGLWREQTAPELAAWNASVDAHAPGQWRANGPLANHPAFADTFGCTPGTGMVRGVDERIAIWR